MLRIKIKVLLFFVLTFALLKVQAQSSVSGFVTDELFGEAVVGAVVKVVQTGENTTTNNYGFYSLSLNRGTYTIIFLYSGYKSDTLTIPVYKGDIQQNIALKTYQIDKVVLRSKNVEDITDAQTGAIDISVSRMKRLPLLLGEVDVIKSVQLLPGVKGGTEGSSGFYVRGGSQDQNLVLLDGVPLYGQNHFFGFFSAFNNDAINSVQLYKGSFPARYGGRLSSVLDVTMKEGNTSKIKGTASLGAIIGRVALDGPLGNNNKTTFAISARSTYINWLIQPLFTAASSDTASTIPSIVFADINLKLSHKINNNNRIFFSIYQGNDKLAVIDKRKLVLSSGTRLEIETDFSLKMRSRTAALRFNRIINKHIFANYTLSYTGYTLKNSANIDYKFITDTSTSKSYYNSDFKTAISDVNLKADFDQKPSLNHHIHYGIGTIIHFFNPGMRTLKADFGNFFSDTVMGKNQKANTLETAAYIEDAMQINKGTKANIGLRAMHYSTLGKNYYFLEPRVALNEQIDSNWIFRMSYALNNQPVHLLANNNLGLPMDIWVPSTKNIKPQKAHQVSLGVIGNLKKGFQVSGDVYYKWLRNAVDIAPGADFISAERPWQDFVRQGNGENYGLELLLQKQEGKLNGWVSYTLSYASRQIAGINNGNTYFFRYDQRHNVSTTWSYELTKRNIVGATGVFSTGYPITVPIGQYLDLDGNIVYEYGGKNNYRMENYFRLDFNFVHYLKPGKLKWAKEAWYNISIYNATSRLNPFFYQVSNKSSTGNGIVLERVSIFPFFPSVSFNVAF